MKPTHILLLLVLASVLWGNPFGAEIEKAEPLYIETYEYAPIRERDNFRGFRWGENRPSVIQKENSRFFTNVLQEPFLLTFFQGDAKDWIPFLTGTVTIGYVFEENKLLLGYYILPFSTFLDASTTYERVKNHFVRLYTSIGSHSLTFINPPYGGIERVLAFYRWQTSNTQIHLTLERDKLVLDPKTLRETNIPFLIVMIYTDAKQRQRRIRGIGDHP